MTETKGSRRRITTLWLTKRCDCCRFFHRAGFLPLVGVQILKRSLRPSEFFANVILVFPALAKFYTCTVVLLQKLTSTYSPGDTLDIYPSMK